MTLAYTLTELIARLSVPDTLKYMLFGIPSDTMIDASEEPTADTAQAENVSMESFREKLDQWIAEKKFLQKNVTIDSLASDLKVSKRQVLKYFQKVCNKDFRAWKAELKIKEAMEMLRENEELKIEEICSVLGFRDKSNFHRQFSKYAGCTPFQWKRYGGR